VKKLFTQGMGEFPMSSVKVMRMVRITGETVVSAHGCYVLVGEANVHSLVLKNIRTRKKIKVSYTAYRKRVSLTLKPGQTVNVQFPFPQGSATKVIEINGKDVEFILSTPDCNMSATCPICSAPVEPDEVDFCPTCGGNA